MHQIFNLIYQIQDYILLVLIRTLCSMIYETMYTLIKKEQKKNIYNKKKKTDILDFHSCVRRLSLSFLSSFPLLIIVVAAH
jgi:hypothetical protein